MKATRAQRKRSKGWRKPDGAVCVTRGTKWGNPFKVTDYGKFGLDADTARKMATLDYEMAIYLGKLPFDEDDVRRELGGKVLLCWCPADKRCHADVLVRIANYSGGQPGKEE